MTDISESRAQAIAYLERLQEQHPLPDMAPEARKAWTKDFMARLKASLDWTDAEVAEIEAERVERAQKMFSRYERPEWFAVASRMIEEIEGVLDRMSAPKSDKKILFGTLATGDVNGRAIPFDNPDYFVVVLDDGVFGYANLLSKALAHAFPLRADDAERLQFSGLIPDVQARLDAKPILVVRLADLLLGYLVGGSPHAAKAYLPDKLYVQPSSAWRDAMEFFILGHEFGHARLGHLDLKVPAMIPHEGYAEIPTDWKMEFEADSFGLFLTLTCVSNRGVNPSISYAGIEAFFLGMDLIGRTLARLRGFPYADVGSETHPPLRLRRGSLRQLLPTLVGEDESKAAIDLADKVGTVMGMMSERIEPFIAEAIGKGARPHPKW